LRLNWRGIEEETEGGEIEVAREYYNRWDNRHRDNNVKNL
jgi:hypothetical protein